MYEAFVTQEPNRQADGMVHFAVEFRDSAGVLPTVTRRTSTDRFTVDWFKQWCFTQLEGLNRVQETAGIVANEKIDLTGVGVVAPNQNVPTQAERDFTDASRRYLRLKAMVDAGLTLPAVLVTELATVKEGIETALAAKPNLSKRYPMFK